MAELVITDLAKIDVGNIWLFYATTRGLDSADKVMNSISKNFEQVLEFPGLGEPQEQFGKGLRRIVVEKTFVVLYQVIPNGVAIVRCIHEARDIDSLMS